MDHEAIHRQVNEMGNMFSGPMFAKSETEHYKRADAKEGMHYSTFLLKDDRSMEWLRAQWPDGEVTDEVIVLFSTSGIGGTYRSIEEAEHMHEEDRKAWPNAPYAPITVLVLFTRTVATFSGEVYPKTEDDIRLLKKLRRSSLSNAVKLAF